MSNPGFIGMFDSGMGGLSVLQEVRAILGGEDLLYYADSAYCPYGQRTSAEIIARSALITGALVQRGAKLIVVACNTATSVALADLRASTGVPIVGMVPAVKPAAATSHGGHIGILATPRTASGDMLADLIAAHASDVAVTTVAAPGLADLVEAGQTSGGHVERVLRPLLDPLVTQGIDTLVLGCTHYPFLRTTIAAMLGPDVEIVDSGAPVARRTHSVLQELNLLRQSSDGGALRMLTSGDPSMVAGVAERLLGERFAVERLAL
ncbi:MAG: glutamate racemase [Thermomicrobiales bacterium]